jgi:hypothetical protein
MENLSAATASGGALWTLLLATLGSTAGQPLGEESVCTARPLAKYSITFTGKWSQTAFPKQYPLFRPPAQWSSLLGKGSSSLSPDQDNDPPHLNYRMGSSTSVWGTLTQQTSIHETTAKHQLYAGRW